MPKWVIYVFLFIFIGALLYAGFTYLTTLTSNTPPQTSGQPTLDATKIAEFTPSYAQNDVVNMIATAMPTPRAYISEPDVIAMDAALVGKQSLLGDDLLSAAKYEAMNVSWYCTDLSLLGWSFPDSNIGGASLIEGKWEMTTSLSDITFTVEKGSAAPPVSGTDASGNPTLETKYNGILVVTISRFGIDGPTILSGNDYSFNVGKQLAGYHLLLFTNTVIKNKSLIEQKQSDMINKSRELVKFETIAPDGTDKILQDMYKQFYASFTETGDRHVYDTLMAIFAPMAREHGFAGLESVRLVMPSPPTSVYGWLDIKGDPLIPQDYPSAYQDSTCESPRPPAAVIEQAKKLADGQ